MIKSHHGFTTEVRVEDSAGRFLIFQFWSKIQQEDFLFSSSGRRFSRKISYFPVCYTCFGNVSSENFFL